MTGYWTLPQSLAWLIFGRSDVDKHASAFDVVNNALRAGSGKLALTVRNEMLDALRQGHMVTYGVAPGKKVHSAIPPIAWLTLDALHAYHPAIPSSAVGIDGDIQYRDVRLRIDDVRAKWPAGVTLARTTEEEARGILEAERNQKGANLTSREIDDLCANKCAGFPREKFRQLAESLQGHKKKGRPAGVRNAQT